MQLITQVTSDVSQARTVTIPSGDTFTLQIRFVPLQLGWFITNLTYKDFGLNGYRIFTSPNILRHYENQLPFGIACLTQDGFEPSLQTDFSTGYAGLFLLSQDEVKEWSDILNGQSA